MRNFFYNSVVFSVSFFLIVGHVHLSASTAASKCPSSLRTCNPRALWNYYNLQTSYNPDLVLRIHSIWHSQINNGQYFDEIN
jgi:hypothetical protein